MENNFIKLETKKIMQDKPHCVFVSILCEDAQPYLNYPHVKKYRDKETIIPMTLLQMRWDSYIGFPGGKVDEEDCINGVVTKRSLINALVREMREEINVDENLIDKKHFKHLCTFTDGTSYIHNYIYKVNYDMFKSIFKGTVNSEHILCENEGSIVCHLYQYSETKGIKQFLKHNFCATAGLELKELLKYLKISY